MRDGHDADLDPRDEVVQLAAGAPRRALLRDGRDAARVVLALERRTDLLAVLGCADQDGALGAVEDPRHLLCVVVVPVPDEQVLRDEVAHLPGVGGDVARVVGREERVEQHDVPVERRGQGGVVQPGDVHPAAVHRSGTTVVGVRLGPAEVATVVAADGVNHASASSMNSMKFNLV